MVDRQIRERGICNVRVLKAMKEVPREQFIPEDSRGEAFEDHPLPIGHGQTISQPYIVGYMSELCELWGQEKVLEIGTGSGYQTAILSHLAKEIYSIERIHNLSRRAASTLKKLNLLNNVTLIEGDGYEGLPREAPFDVILLTAAPLEPPDSLLQQLAPGGRLIAPVGDDLQRLIRIRRQGNKFHHELICYVSFVPMKHGVI